MCLPNLGKLKLAGDLSGGGKARIPKRSSNGFAADIMEEIVALDTESAEVLESIKALL